MHDLAVHNSSFSPAQRGHSSRALIATLGGAWFISVRYSSRMAARRWLVRSVCFTYASIVSARRGAVSAARASGGAPVVAAQVGDHRGLELVLPRHALARLGLALERHRAEHQVRRRPALPPRRHRARPRAQLRGLRAQRGRLLPRRQERGALGRDVLLQPERLRGVPHALGALRVGHRRSEKARVGRDTDAKVRRKKNDLVP